MGQSDTRSRVGNRPLLVGAAWAVAAALAGRDFGLVPGCAVAAAAIGWSIWRRRAGPWVWALPAAFAAGVTTTPAQWPEPGPVWIAGVVQPGVRSNPIRGDCSFRVASHRQEFLCIVVDAPSEFGVLPGDVVRGFGRLPEQPERRRRGRLPRVITTPDALRVEPGGPGLWRVAASCRQAMQRTLLRFVPGEHGILLCHLVLGSGPELPADLVAAHRATGLSHLLAVSGAHLTMLGWLLGFAFATATRRSPLASPRFRRVCAVVLFFYGLITGMEPPVFRAVIAMFVFLIGGSRGRRVPVATVLALPAILTAVVAPEDLFGVSFNLSYVAVIGLALSGGLRGRTFAGRWIRGPLLCSLWATLCTTPLTLWYFGKFAPWTLLATPLLSPLVAMMLGLGLIVTCLAPVLPWLAVAVSWPLTGITVLYSTAVRVTSDLPLAPVYANAKPDFIVLGLAALVGLTILLHLRNRGGIAAVCIALSIPHFLPARAQAPPGLQLLAVGHGHAGLLTLRDGTAVLIDCGNLGNPRRAASVVAAALLPRRTLDLLVLTHGDFDHVGGVVGLLDRVWVARALLPTEMREGGIARALAEQGCRIELLPPGARRLPHPDLLVHRPSTSATNRNDRSAWVHASFGSFRAILTGDALEACTADWLDSDLATTADVLVLPHHGRPNAESARLLARVRPGIALVSSASIDGISAQGRRAAAAGCEVLHTGIVGSVHVLATEPPTVTTEWPRVLRATPTTPAEDRPPR